MKHIKLKTQTVADRCDRVIRIEYGIISEEGANATGEAPEVASGASLKNDSNSMNNSSAISSKSLGVLRSFSTAYKNIRKNKLRNVLVSIGTGIAIFSVVSLLFLSIGIGNYVRNQMYSQANPLLVEVTKQGQSDGGIRRNAVFSRLDPFTDNEIKELSESAGVDSVEKGCIITGSVSMSVGDSKENIAMLSTINKYFSPDLKKGSLPQKGQILISQSVADAIGGDYAALIGKEILIDFGNDDGQGATHEKYFSISGIIENDGSPASRLKTAYINFDDIADASIEQSSMPVNILYLTAKSEKDVDFIKTSVEKSGFSLNSRDSAMNRIISFISTVTAGLTGVAAVSLVVSGIMVLVVLFISVVERTKEIGTLRAIGARAADIRRLFLSEGTLLGLWSGVIGVLIAVVISGIANRILQRIIGVKIIAINLPNIFAGILISVGISMLASLIPAAKASGLDPVESLRHE